MLVQCGKELTFLLCVGFAVDLVPNVLFPLFVANVCVALALNHVTTMGWKTCGANSGPCHAKPTIRRQSADLKDSTAA